MKKYKLIVMLAALVMGWGYYFGISVMQNTIQNTFEAVMILIVHATFAGLSGLLMFYIFAEES